MLQSKIPTFVSHVHKLNNVFIAMLLVPYQTNISAFKVQLVICSIDYTDGAENQPSLRLSLYHATLVHTQ